ncbi:MAG: DUF6868 family protein [Coraliomargarita sp.]
MNDLDSLRSFFGWCTVIHLVLLLLSTFFLMVARGWVIRIHSKLFGLSEAQLAEQYFRYLAMYKVGVLIFCLVPYLALVLMGQS